MKYSRLILILLIGTIYSCSNSNKEYIEIIKQQLKDDSQGLELNYKNLEFKWVDTLKVHEKISEIEQDFGNRINEILNIDYYVKDNFKEGKLFSKAYITYDRLNELRNWERNRRNESSLESAKVINDESIFKFQDYYEYAFENRTASDWLTRLCAQIERTDSLLNIYNELEEGNIELMETALWYYNRIDDFHTNHNPDPIWEKVSNELDTLRDLKTEIDSLRTFNPDKVVYYKAFNNYKINNPYLNGTEQELKKFFYFDDNKAIIKIEDY